MFKEEPTFAEVAGLTQSSTLRSHPSHSPHGAEDTTLEENTREGKGGKKSPESPQLISVSRGRICTHDRTGKHLNIKDSKERREKTGLLLVLSPEV